MVTRQTIADLIETWTPQIQKAFLAGVDVLRDQAQLALIIELLRRGDVDGAVRAVGLDPAAFTALDTTIAAGFLDAGQQTAATIPASIGPQGHRLQVLFGIRNPRAEQWLRDNLSQLVTEILTDQREMIQTNLEAGMKAGLNPRTVALDLVGRIDPVSRKRTGGTIGLTTSQDGGRRNYAAALASAAPGDSLDSALRDKRFDAAVARAILTKTPIPAVLQAKMVTAYKNRALRYRAETIARTEALTSLHQAQHEAYSQAIDTGQVQAKNVKKILRSAHDARVRETHRELDGQTVGMHESFVSVSGARLLFPGDTSLGAPASEVVACRCDVAYRVDYLGGVT